jgi:hypothetical protein
LKRSSSLVVLTIAAFFSMALLTSAASVQEGHGAKHGFSVKQYDDFHEVLHPLQHEALPNRNFKEIRAQAALLIRRGRAIVRLGVPRGTSKENRAEFGKELAKFNRALTQYNRDARRGTDARLEGSYSAVHDSFEMLVALLPRA